MKNTTTKRIGLAAVVLGLALGAAGRAKATVVGPPPPPDTDVTFNAGGTFGDGATLGGSLTIDTTIGSVISSALTVTAGADSTFFGTLTFDSIPTSQNELSDNLTYEVNFAGAGNSFPLTLEIEATNSLVGYTGSMLNAGNPTASPDPNAPSTSFIAPTIVVTAASDPYMDPGTGNLTPATAAPEPSTLVSAGIGVLMGLGYAWRHRKRAATA